MSSTAAVEFDGVTKHYTLGLGGGRVRALNELRLSIPAGEVFGLLGPNGSGKSTCIKILLGLTRPTMGTCRIFGTKAGPAETRQQIGYLPEDANFPRYLTGRELVNFYGRMCGLPRKTLPGKVAEVIEQVGLSGAADRRIGTYSKGMRQRIGLAQALVHDPALVVLDEPTAGVDPVATEEIGKIVGGLRNRGRTVLVTSHLLAQMERVCDRIAILEQGKLLLEGEVGALLRKSDATAVRLTGASAATLAELTAWLGARGVTVTKEETPARRLDEIYLEQVGRKSRREGDQ